MKVYKLEGKTYVMKGKNLVELKAETLKAKIEKTPIQVLEAYLNSKKVVNKFGKQTITATKPSTYTRKSDNKIIDVLEATLSNNAVFLATKNTCWKKQ